MRLSNNGYRQATVPNQPGKANRPGTPDQAAHTGQVPAPARKLEAAHDTWAEIPLTDAGASAKADATAKATLPTPPLPKQQRPVPHSKAAALPLTQMQQLWLAKLTQWSRDNCELDDTHQLPHPMFEVLGTQPAHWGVLAVGLSALRARDAAVRGAGQPCRTDPVVSPNVVVDLWVDSSVTVFCEELVRLQQLCNELTAIHDVIAYLATEMPWTWNAPMPAQDLAPLEALRNELRHASRRLHRDDQDLCALRDHANAALGDLLHPTSDTFPLWVPDIFARPARRLPIRDADDYASVRVMYTEYTKELAATVTGTIRPLRGKLEESWAFLGDVREALTE